MMCLAAIWLGFTSAALAAYDFPLDSESIREAYFLGRCNDEKTIKCLASYFKRLPLPEKGPHISEISLYTPYAQIVLNSSRNAGSPELARRCHGRLLVVRGFVIGGYTPSSKNFDALLVGYYERDALMFAAKRKISACPIYANQESGRQFRGRRRRRGKHFQPHALMQKPSDRRVQLSPFFSQSYWQL
jgi:hypothetical protein